MALRFCSLGSGSAGNATVVEARDGTTTTRLLIDAGFSLRELEGRLARSGLAGDAIDALFITHEHVDHVGCALGFARRHRVPLITSRGTWRAIGRADWPAELLRLVRDGDALALGDLALRPYTVAHDAAEPLQLGLGDGARRLGILTDAGSITPHMLANLAGCEALILECNHDRDLLAASTYPPSLKARISGRYGHLANELAAQVLAECLHAGLRHLVAAHLSERNNTPALARAALATPSGAGPADIVVADPVSGFGWLALG